MLVSAVQQSESGTYTYQIRSVAQSCLTLFDPMNHSTPGLPVHHQLPSSLRLTSSESVMPSSHLMLCRPLLLLPSFSSFTFIKRLHSSSSLSAIRVVSSAYLRLLIFLLVILTPAYTSSSPAFLMMYSAYKLNKQGDNIQP